MVDSQHDVINAEVLESVHAYPLRDHSLNDPFVSTPEQSLGYCPLEYLIEHPAYVWTLCHGCIQVVKQVFDLLGSHFGPLLHPGLEVFVTAGQVAVGVQEPSEVGSRVDSPPHIGLANLGQLPYSYEVLP